MPGAGLMVESRRFLCGNSARRIRMRGLLVSLMLLWAAAFALVEARAGQQQDSDTVSVPRAACSNSKYWLGLLRHEGGCCQGRDDERAGLGVERGGAEDWVGRGRLNRRRMQSEANS